ncbi:MAG: recombinase family protein [Anaerocolumna sp.]
MQTAALYIRVSTEDQAEYSPDAQKRLLLEYAKNNNLSVNIDNIFIDEGISGRKAEKRPGFMKMIATAKKKPKPFDIILVHRFDRFSRSREDSIVYKSLLRKDCDIKVISITEQLEDDKFSVILEAMLEAMAEYYSLNLADEVTKGMTEKALRGGYQANPPLGYKIIHNGDIPVIVPEESAIIKLIFEKYVYGNLTFYQIAKYLNSLGCKTKKHKDFERRSVEYILANPMYKGYIRWNRTHNASKTIRDPSDWIIVKGRHEPVISEELYELAQKRRDNECITQHKARPVTEYKHWLSGIVKCSNCGRSMTAAKAKNSRFLHFCCNGYSKGKCPVCNSISENKLVPFVMDALEKVRNTCEVNYSPIKNESFPELALLEHQIVRLNEKENRIKKAYINGIDNLEEYKENKSVIQKERIILEHQCNHYKAENSLNDEKSHLNCINNVYNIINSDTINNTTKNKALKTIIEKIVFNGTERSLDIYFYDTLLL